jgi:hypothetical protein
MQDTSIKLANQHLLDPLKWLASHILPATKMMPGVKNQGQARTAESLLTDVVEKIQREQHVSDSRSPLRSGR